MALDEGQVCAGRRSASISELELELKRGKPGDVVKLAREMVKLVPAKLALKSKAERGYDLIDHRPIQAVCAEKIKLRPGTSTADAFRIIGRSTLRHITANEIAVQRSDSESVHQMRTNFLNLPAAAPGAKKCPRRWRRVFSHSERNPFCAADNLPNHPEVDRKDDDSRQKTDREHDAVLLQIAQRDQSDQNGGKNIAERIGANSSLALSIITATPTTRLVASRGVG